MPPWWVPMSLLGALALLVAPAAVGHRDAPEALEPAARLRLRDLGLQTLGEGCVSPAGAALAHFCRHQAEVLVQLPECDGGCLDRARPHLSHATR